MHIIKCIIGHTQFQYFIRQKLFTKLQYKTFFDLSFYEISCLESLVLAQFLFHIIGEDLKLPRFLNGPKRTMFTTLVLKKINLVPDSYTGTNIYLMMFVKFTFVLKFYPSPRNIFIILMF